MIGVASYPVDLKTWEPDQDHYYLELFGETQPVINTTYAEVVPASSVEGAAPASQMSSVYEYWWTIGHPGHPDLLPHFWDILGREPDDFWQGLSDPAGRVFVYFPTWGGWRIKEVVATVKYLIPVPNQESFWNQAAKDWQVLQPLVSDASLLAGAVVPGVGAAAGGAASLLSMIAQLKINSVPQAEGFKWSVGKVAYRSDTGVMQGVMWTLTKKMFMELGGRLTGSIALSFIPATQERDEAAQLVPQRLPFRAHAVVYGPDNAEEWKPARDRFVELNVSPALPA